uniref:Protein CUSTOS n=1 Tax=Graphocephala atropunctata TaxID=36148 RepID=A0A1B6MJD6_9HEMI
MDTETSSDEEDRSKLLQAMDKQFLNEDWYSKRTSKTENLEPDTLPPSLRNTDNELRDQSSMVIGLNVTPEFQRFVAKHLSVLLDKQLKEVELTKPRCEKKSKRKKKGVRLLHTSSSYLDVEDVEDISVVHNAKRKSRAEPDVDSEEESARVRETAVSAEWVMNGEATKGWAKSTKGEVMEGTYGNSAFNGKSKKKKKKKLKDQQISLIDNQ